MTSDLIAHKDINSINKYEIYRSSIITVQLKILTHRLLNGNFQSVTLVK